MPRTKARKKDARKAKATILALSALALAALISSLAITVSSARGGGPAPAIPGTSEAAPAEAAEQLTLDEAPFHKVAPAAPDTHGGFAGNAFHQ